ncbi:YnaM/YnfT family protein, partial [Enterobacter hormaechei]|uniref:YnaM/YnfT family protein n=1 Tax=Enterobacter hormaechei TaxID=158836 RepID=UPI000B044577
KRAYCLKTQPATGETYPKSDLFNKASNSLKDILTKGAFMTTLIISTIVAMVLALMILSLIKIGISVSNNPDEL